MSKVPATRPPSRMDERVRPGMQERPPRPGSARSGAPGGPDSAAPRTISQAIRRGERQALQLGPESRSRVAGIEVDRLDRDARVAFEKAENAGRHGIGSLSDPRDRLHASSFPGELSLRPVSG